MKRFLMSFFVISLALAVAAGAASRKGETVIEIQGGWAMETGVETTDLDSFRAGATGGDLDGWFVSGGIAWFTSDNFQIGIAGVGAGVKADNVTGAADVAEPGFPPVPDAQGFDVDSDVTLYGVGGRAKWHFKKTGKWLPYVGIQGFWVTSTIDITGVSTGPLDPGAAISESVDADGILWGPIVGVGIPLSAGNNLTVEYQYHMWQGDIGDALDSGHTIAVGLTHKLK